MRVVLDTNVLMSGIFFSGPPHEILSAWRHGAFEMAISPAVFGEYQRIGDELAQEYPAVDAAGMLDLVVQHAVMVDAPALPVQVCEDADDDQFIACALAARAAAIVSGDKLLRKVSAYKGVQILSPRAFVDSYLGKGGR